MEKEIKRRLAAILLAEDSKRPYSDKQIAELLRDHNIDITKDKVAVLREDLEKEIKRRIEEFIIDAVLREEFLIASKRKT